MSAPAPDSSSVVLPLAERVAQLEERTKPKAKSWLDHVKEWGGVGTVLIAILYTFPTGVWQQYFLPEKKAAEDLRSVIDQTSMIFADAVKAMSSAKDDQTAMQLNRSYTTRAYTLMARQTPSFERYASELTPPELLVVGTMYGQVNMPALSVKFLDKAMAASRTTSPNGKASTLTDPMTYFTAARGKAAVLFMPGTSQNVPAARELFRVATKDASASTSPMEMLAFVDLKGNWAWMELTFGDYACGRTLLQETLDQYLALELGFVDGGRMRTMFESMRGMAPKPGQAAAGCAT